MKKLQGQYGNENNFEIEKEKKNQSQRNLALNTLDEDLNSKRIKIK